MDIPGIQGAVEAAETAPKNGLGDQDAFLTLLITQLRTQNPLEPLDPNQFVSQLVEFNTLEQIMQIRQVLETNANTATGFQTAPETGNPQ